MNIYFTTINQSPKPMKYTGMNLSYYLLGLLTNCKIFSSSSTRLPGPDKSDLSPLVCTFTWSVSVASKSIQLSFPLQLSSFFLYISMNLNTVCLSQMDYTFSLEILLKVIFFIKFYLIRLKKAIKTHSYPLVSFTTSVTLSSVLSHSPFKGSKATQIHQMLQEFSSDLVWSASVPHTFTIFISLLKALEPHSYN